MKKYIVAIITILIMLAPLIIWAQGPDGGDLDGDPGVPIDGGVSLLAGAAVAYGIKRLKKRKQDSK